MNLYINNKKTKKFIIALVVLILFSFCYPKQVKADFLDDLAGGVGRLLWTIEKGAIKGLNNLFVRDGLQAQVMGTDVTGPDGNTYFVEELSIYLTPENIIKGKFLLFDANIFKEVTKEDYYDLELDAVGNPTGSVAKGRIKLREIVSGWYYALRNLAIVALLSVLVYVGIRMILSTIAQDKAKYKMMFKDWLIAFCLLILMHYLMIGILNITSMIVDAIGTGTGSNLMSGLASDISGTLSDGAKDNDWTYVRKDGETFTVSDAFFSMLVMLGVLVYTLIFAVKYLKREFTIIFLILLGPISCITYPIDKISDGKSQAFNRWFSEFLYQVIIQPFHLLLFIVLIGSAAELARANVLYALVCFAILIPSEKFIKEMFGFKDKLGSPLGAMATGAIAGKAISSLFSGSKGSGGAGGSAKAEIEGKNAQDSLPPRTVDKKELSGAGEDSEAIAAGAGAGAGIAAQNAANENNGQAEDETEADRAQEIKQQKENIESGIKPEIEAKKDELNKANNADSNTKEPSLLSKALATHNRRAALKWGSTSMKQRWINRGKSAGKGALRLAGRTAKFGARAAGIGAGALVGGAVGMAFGKGAAGAGIGMALGSKVGGVAIKGATGIVKGTTKAASDYYYGFKGTEALEKKQLKQFKSDPSQMEKARFNYMATHDNQEPTVKQLDQELTDRFELSRYGFDDDLIDRAVGEYQNLRDVQHVPAAQALNETAYATKLAKDYAKGDFRNAEKMENAKNAISQMFQSKGATKAVADANAQKYLRQAAKIKGAEISLPSTNQTVDVKLPPKEVKVSTDTQKVKMKAKRHSNLRARVQQDIIEKPEIKTELETELIDEVTTTIDTDFDILPEFPDFDDEIEVSDSQKVTRSEKIINLSKNLANKSRGNFSNESHMLGVKQKLINELKEEGYSDDAAIEDAKIIMEKAARNNGESLPEGW